MKWTILAVAAVGWREFAFQRPRRSTRTPRGGSMCGDWRFRATCAVWNWVQTDTYRFCAGIPLRGRFLATVHKRSWLWTDGGGMDERRTVGVGDRSLRSLGVRLALWLAMDAGHTMGAAGFVA